VGRIHYRRIPSEGKSGIGKGVEESADQNGDRTSMSFLAFQLMAENWFDQAKLDVRMTPRYLTASISIDHQRNIGQDWESLSRRK